MMDLNSVILVRICSFYSLSIMAKLNIENLPDDLIQQLKILAHQNHQTLNEQVINLLKQAIHKPQPPLKFLISPETDNTWEERRQAIPDVLAKIQARLEQRQKLSVQGLDSTMLLREDRNR